MNCLYLLWGAALYRHRDDLLKLGKNLLLAIPALLLWNLPRVIFDYNRLMQGK